MSNADQSDHIKFDTFAFENTLSMSTLPKRKRDNNRSGSGKNYKRHKGTLLNVLCPLSLLM